MDAFEEDTNPFRSDSEDTPDTPPVHHDQEAAFESFHHQVAPYEQAHDQHRGFDNGTDSDHDNDNDNDNDNEHEHDNDQAASDDYGTHTQSSGFQDSAAATSVQSGTTQRTTPAALTPAPQTFIPRQPAVKTEFCCGRDRFLHSGHTGVESEIHILDAVKTSENSASPYIAYIIQTGTVETRRRYSEFESLRTSLVKLYPTYIVPPIPSKQSLSDYAVKQAKAKEDAGMISRRKRMLQVFLNRIAKHAILSNEHVFHRFLDRDVSWSEVLHSPPLSQLPKNILKAPAHDPLDNTLNAAYAALPTPSATQTLRHPDQRFLDSEAFTAKFSTHLSGSMEKVTRRTMKRWSEYSHDHAELGALLNGFSLSEEGTLAGAIEKTGQAVDATYISTMQLLQDLEQSWTEPLHEYSQFALIIKKLLAYRHQRHAQYEITQDALESKKVHLEELERQEAEARRLEEALATGTSRLGSVYGRFDADGQSSAPLPGSTSTDGLSSSQSPQGESTGATPTPRPTSFPSTSASASTHRRRASTGTGLLSALSYSLQGIMDVDPSTARRNNISKTRDAIAQLESTLQASAQDLKFASSTIQADLDRFQRQKVADLREMAIVMAKIHKEWCRRNLEVWEAAKKEIEKIEPHPNRPPPGEVLPSSGVAGPSMTASAKTKPNGTPH
ncbi:hypothetical protein BOTBODRAFT_102975 [Botryobasidium botryosum FD-172 SS1]|uniref:PX domain-containing protein n=1 Tax=Botryobasidium botryosum (strain FD-172 SS1) TaxID=930990 RepID=A0A067N4L7_BOTB1|nr:hypothetical protein BOTBODRAFT_102975 [Botryobasidium botryosum FD-172 SS1]